MSSIPSSLERLQERRQQQQSTTNTARPHPFERWVDYLPDLQGKKMHNPHPAEQHAALTEDVVVEQDDDLGAVVSGDSSSVAKRVSLDSSESWNDDEENSPGFENPPAAIAALVEDSSSLMMIDCWPDDDHCSDDDDDDGNDGVLPDTPMGNNASSWSDSIDNHHMLLPSMMAFYDDIESSLLLPPDLLWMESNHELHGDKERRKDNDDDVDMETSGCSNRGHELGDTTGKRSAAGTMEELFQERRSQLAASMRKSKQSRKYLEQHMQQRANLAGVLSDIERSSKQILEEFLPQQQQEQHTPHTTDSTLPLTQDSS